MSENHQKISFQNYLTNRLSDDEVKHNGFHEITPYHLLESLEKAKKELNSSNYDCGNYDRIIEILIRYCEQNYIFIE